MSAPHPLDDPQQPRAAIADSPHYPAIEPGRSYPLSLLVFLITLSSLFLAAWRISPELAIGSLILVSPGLLRTMWIVEQKRLDGQAMSFSEQLWMWTSSTLMITGALTIFAGSFMLSFAAVVWLGYVGGSLLLGPNGDYDGLVIGVLMAMPISSAVAILAAGSLLRFTWGRDLDGPVDMRN